MKLSILIPTVHNRRNTFLPRILDQVYSQYDKLSPEKQKEVEILVFMDNKTIMLGDKRNLMIEQAQGEYVVFIDDDDRISDKYIDSILMATYENKDAIVFLCEVTVNNGIPKVCYYSKDYIRDYNDVNNYYRLPNHICAVKKEIAEKVEFPSIAYGEDSGYSKKLKPLLKSETKINEVLYYYDFNSETTETQMFLKNNRQYKKPKVYIPSILDLVILSNAKDSKFKNMTDNAIKSALDTSKEYKINIIVMEQQDEINYDNAITMHYDGEFNYNAIANLGISDGNSPYIMVANNDLIFKDNWLFNLLKVNYPVVSPKCPRDSRQKEFSINTTGYEVGKHFSGWCFMIKRNVWEEIGGLDEDFPFWCADNATVKQLQAKGYIPMLVVDSIVEHLGSQTLKTLDTQNKQKMTHDQVKKYNLKYKDNLFNRH